MKAVLSRRFATAKDEDDWEKELKAWGVIEEREEPEPLIPLYEANIDVVEWWISIPSFLRFNHTVCLGMDVLAVKADAELSCRDVTPLNYQKLKHIARVVTEELNQREQSRS